jgi:ATP-dependent phosphoenolpyruvate carboxykinase
MAMGDDYVHTDIKILDIPFKAGWVEEATLEPVSEYLSSDEFQNQLKLLTKITHQVVIN